MQLHVNNTVKIKIFLIPVKYMNGVDYFFLLVIWLIPSWALIVSTVYSFGYSSDIRRDLAFSFPAIALSIVCAYFLSYHYFADFRKLLSEKPVTKNITVELKK